MTSRPISQEETPVLNVSNSDVTRSEVRQFLVALYALAFVMSTMGMRDGGPMAFAADIVLVLCGGWAANQLIRGMDVLKEQVICVLQAYFTGLLCCSIVLFVIGWLIFLPSEFQNLGHALLTAATFTTNLQIAFLPTTTPLRFDGLLNHLWVPALIAQCCAILAFVYWLTHRNAILMMTVLGAIFVVSLSLSTSQSPIVQMLPLGGLWAFVGGALPFLAANRFPILHYALLLGIVTLATGILAAVTTGDTLFARAFIGLSFALLYLGSRSVQSKASKTKQRRRWFGLAMHVFLWALPLAQVTSGLNISDPSTSSVVALLVPSMFLALISWSVWQKVEERVELSRVTPTGVIALLLLANGVTTLASQGLQIRYAESTNAYINAIESTRHARMCPERTDGPFAGLDVCEIGPKGAPTVLIWGDHQLTSLLPGYEEAARKTNVSALVIKQANCVPLDGLQTRFSQAGQRTGRTCDQHSAQVLQALPHITSIKQVTIVADWLYYTGTKDGFKQRNPVRLGPLDGTPINIADQATYVAQAAKDTIQQLEEQGLRVSIVRQIPKQPSFDAEIAARAASPGGWMYQAMPRLDIDVPMTATIERHAKVDEMFTHLSATGRIHYVNTWPTFCSDTRCSARGGLASDYVSATDLTPTGALALVPVLEADLKRSRTHIAHRIDTGN